MTKNSGGKKKVKSKVADAAQEPVPYRELEHKYIFANPEKAMQRFGKDNLRDCYKAVYESIKRSRKTFPDISSQIDNPYAKEILQGLGTHRSNDDKDPRIRVYYTDRNFQLVDQLWELRLQVDTNALMIKQGDSANAHDPTLSRDEIRYDMVVPRLLRLGDIPEYSKENKKLPKALRELFGESVNDVALYNAVMTASRRNKLVYFRKVAQEIAGNSYEFSIGLEFARDEVNAFVLKEEFGQLDQFENEAERVIDRATGINILKYPERIGLKKEDVKELITDPQMRTEDTLLYQLYDLVAVFDSKPTKALAEARKIMSAEEGVLLAEQVRKEHAGGTIWQALGPELVML